MEPLQPDSIEIARANARHDAEHGHPFEFERTRIRPGWVESKVVMRGKLTDRKISKYAKLGRYSEQYKNALRLLMAMKKSGVRPPNKDGVVFSV